MRFAMRYAAPVLAAGVAVTVAASAASAARGPDQGSGYGGQCCGAYSDYSNTPDDAAAPCVLRGSDALGGSAVPSLDPATDRRCRRHPSAPTLRPDTSVSHGVMT